VALPAKLNVRCDLAFNSSGDLTTLTQNNGWTVSGGSAVSTSTTASGTTKRFMLMSCANWAGVVEADIKIQDQVGLVIGAPSSSYDGGTGVYFGIFYDARTGGYYYKLWNEYCRVALGSGRAKVTGDTDAWVESRCKVAAGTAVTVKLGARTDGWYVQINGKETLWLKSSSRLGTYTAAARTGVRAGAWATVAGATIDRLKVSEAINRQWPSANTALFIDSFSRANGAYDASLADIPYTPAPGTTSWNIVSNQLSMPASIGGTLFPQDADAPDLTEWGVAYTCTFQYISGSMDMTMLGTVSLAVCTATPGSQVSLALGVSAGKGGTSWLSTYGTAALASGTWVQIRVFVPYNNVLAGAVPPYAGGSTEVHVSTGTSNTGPWTERVVLTALPTAVWSGSSVAPGASGCVVDNVLFNRAPITDIFPSGSWPMDYSTNADGPGDFYSGLGADTVGRPGLLYIGADFMSRLVESG
jgi:hypothetical protein